MRDTKFAQVVEGRFFGKRKEFSFINNTRIRRHREVAQVGLIDHYIRHVGHGRTYVGFPSFGVGSLEVDDRRTLTVYRNGFGEDTRCFGCPLAVLIRTNGVVLTGQIALDGSCPKIVCSFGESYGLVVSRIGSVIEMDFHLLGRIGPEGELRFRRVVQTFVFEFRLLAGASD